MSPDFPDQHRSTAPIKVHRAVPYLHVADLAASERFYKLLGMDLTSRHCDPSGRAVWARMQTCGAAGADLMLALASGPIDPDQQAAMLYMHVDDVAGLRAQLLAGGVQDVSHHPGYHAKPTPTGVLFAIQHPFYMPAGELRVHDPDGYVIQVGQWPREV
jgi:catechol 2,3-dioxygenase-like lactoylglutathione lyase family enzyme